MNAKVDRYLGKVEKWQEELETLRRIILDCGLIEELKWGAPCYTFMNSNILIIGGYKDCCVLSFFKGALLVDDRDILSKPGENSQAARVIRFAGVREIVKMEPILKAYIYEAIEVEKAGLKVKFKKNPEPIPEEFGNMMDKMPALKAAFEALTPGRQRAYILYFSAPKLSRTRESRIRKHMKQILQGKGINDDYLNGLRDGGKGRKP
jgi:uncharacterized protein YdeI (YjbR/CyaY-like superfamily)